MLEYKNTEYGMKLVKNQLLTEKVVCAETDGPYNKGVVDEKNITIQVIPCIKFTMDLD